MKYIAKIEQSATESQPYIQTVTFDAANDVELDKLLDEYANYGQGKGITVDNSKMPARFNESGGFASTLISFVDENGRDVSHLERGAF